MLEAMSVLFLVLRMGLCRSAYPEFLIDAWDQWDDEENSENDRPGEPLCLASN